MRRTDAADAARAYACALEDLGRRAAGGWTVTDWSDGAMRWRFFRPVATRSPEQGWKVHVSASAAESAACLNAVSPVLLRLGAAFKLPRTADDVVLLNSGDGGLESLGKVVTVYPEDDDHLRAIVERIDAVWPSSRGPEVVTDLHSRPGSAVSFRYGVFATERRVVDARGIHAHALLRPDGSLVADRRAPFPDGTPHPAPPLRGFAPTVLPVRLDEPLRVGGCEYVPLVELAATARAVTCLAVDVQRVETVVLKVGRPGVAGDLHGVDMVDLFEREFRVLRALEAREGGVAPRALQWHRGPWPVLVMEDFRGELLSELPRAQRVARLPLLAQALARVHEAGWVHGDVKLENAVNRGPEVGLIDFELGQRRGQPMRRGGTRGCRAPEADEETAADGARDVYALGGCIVQAVLDIPPGLLPPDPRRFAALLRHDGAGPAARLVERFMAADPARRPGAHEAAAMLGDMVGELAAVPPAARRRHGSGGRRWAWRASVDAAALADTYARDTATGRCWRNTHFQRHFDCEALNLGAAGILLGLQTIDHASGRSDFGHVIRRGARWLASRPAAGNAAGLFTGNAGVALALALVGRRWRRDDCLVAARRRFTAALADQREIDLFSGSAGVVWTACLLAGMLGSSWPLEAASDAASALGRQAQREQGVPVWRAETGDEVFFGCAHGSAGIAMALACWGRAAGDDGAVRLARDTFRAVARHGRSTDGSALLVGPRERRPHAVGNWCHGVAGLLWSILQAFGDDPDLRTEIDWAVERLADAVPVGTATCCHGLAGQLELWRMLGGVERFRGLALERAGKVVQSLRIVHVKVEGRCAWPSDDPDVTTPDLWVGFLGPAAALAMHARGCAWPLLSVPWLSACAQPRAGEDGRDA